MRSFLEVFFLKQSFFRCCGRNFVFFLFLVLSVSLYGEDNAEVLPSGYKDFTFGLTMEEVKILVDRSPEFNALREEVLTIRTEPDRQILTVRGLGFVKQGYFHFHENKLFHIYLIFNETRIGYYNLLKTLTSKYGNPVNFQPSRAVWKDEHSRVMIEKPSIIKYTSVGVWEMLGSTDLSDRNFEQMQRDRFLDGL